MESLLDIGRFDAGWRLESVRPARRRTPDIVGRRCPRFEAERRSACDARARMLDATAATPRRSAGRAPLV
ncbi:hypothetical protein [Burkholderia mayonis]|nr:hypothetical protein [Burkholderia mayonis]